MRPPKYVVTATASLIALGSSCPARQADPQKFTFDNGFASTPGLQFRFTRPVPTVDYAGLPVAPDQPRPCRASTLAAAPQIVQVRASTALISVLAFGVDHDGITPLMVTSQTQPPRLDVFTVAGDELLAAESTGVGRNRTVLKAGGDIMLNAYPGKRYVPVSGAVAHGLIVLFCVVRELDPYGQWVEDGVGFVTSQDQGRTWSLLYDDGPIQAGHKRAREWCMTNWWPLSQGADPLEAWFAATDYRANPGSTGGRLLIFRATRAGVGEPWVIGPASRVYEQDGGWEEHFHSAGIVPVGANGFRVVLSIGDGQPINRIVSLKRADADYLSPDGWSVDETYHGSEGTPGTQGNQFAGAAPFAGGMLIGGDVGNEHIMRLDCGPFDPHPTTSFVYGLGSVNGSNDCSDFIIKSAAPNVPDTPYVSWTQIGGRGLPGSRYARRVLYSPDGVRWAQAINPESTQPPSVAVHGSDIYFDRRTDPKGLYRAPVPRVLTRVPLLIGPGGLQRLIAAPGISPGSGGTLTALARSDEGLWLDGGVPIDPQPPALGQVYRVTSSKDAATKNLGIIRPTGAVLDFGNTLGTDSVTARYWIRNLEPGKTCAPRVILRSSDAKSKWNEDIRDSVVDRWLPYSPTHMVSVAAEKRLEFFLSAGPTTDDEDFYLALDSASEGLGMAGYPLPPDSSNPPVGTMNPDETAAVSGFVCGPAWTITLAGAIPEDGFDGTVTTTQRWPLAAIWADADDSIQLIADTKRRRLVIEIRRAGKLAGSIESSEIYWLRGSSILVSLSDAGDGTGVQATLSVGSLPVREASPTIGWTTASLAQPPMEVRFGDASGQSGDGLTVRQSPMLWWGGQIDVDTARGPDERAAMLTSLSFLDLPPGRPGCPADFDGDGVLTVFDFMAFQSMYAAGDPRADLDKSTGEHVLDLLDFTEFVNQFQIGCGK